MTQVTVRPNATTANYYSSYGGSSFHGDTSDNNDSTSFALTGSYSDLSYVTLGLGDISPPAGAVIANVAARMRTKIASAGNDSTVNVQAPGINANHTITWTSLTTATVATVANPGISAATINAGTFKVSYVYAAPYNKNANFYEIYYDVVYVAKPVPTVANPTGTITTTNTPQVTWTNVLDADGGAQTHYQVRFYTAAQYGAGGFNPASSTPTQDTGTVAASSLNYTTSTPLADDTTYRAYVRTAQTVNGTQHWSDWSYSGFSLDLPNPPSTPTLAATGDNTNARITLAATKNGAVAYTGIEMEYQDGSDWLPVRAATAMPVATTSGLTLYDYEASNGVQRSYRARAYNGVMVSDWTATQDATWSDSTKWWLKHPHLPSLNVNINVRSLGSLSQQSRQGVFQPLGSPYPIVVSDTRGARSGELVIYLASLNDQDDIDALLDTYGTLLLQAPPTQGGNMFIAIASQGRSRIVDWADATRVFDTLPFVEVGRPAGNLEE